MPLRFRKAGLLPKLEDQISTGRGITVSLPFPTFLKIELTLPLVLRSLAEGRIKWAFWPPETKATSMSHDTGIWLSSMVGDEEETWDDISSSSGSEEPDVIRTISDQEPNGSAEEGESEVLTTFSRFKVLALEDTQIESIGYS